MSCALNDPELCLVALVFGGVLLALLCLVIYLGFIAWKDPGFYSLARPPARPPLRKVKGRARRGQQ